MMNQNRALPDDPLIFIRRCVVNMRLATKSISRRVIIDSIHAYEIIETYPDDKYLPSYLVYTEYQGKRYHILFAADVKRENIRVVTTYRPSSIEWLPDLKTRRKAQ